MKKVFIFSSILLSFMLSLISFSIFSKTAYADVVTTPTDEQVTYYEFSLSYREEIFFGKDKAYTGKDALIQAKNEIYTKLNNETPNKYVDNIINDNDSIIGEKFTNSGFYIENYQYVTDNLFYHKKGDLYRIPVGSAPGDYISTIRESFDCLLSNVAYWKVTIEDFHYVDLEGNHFTENLEFVYLKLEDIPDLSNYYVRESDINTYIHIEPVYYTDFDITINCEDISFMSNTFGVNKTSYSLPITESSVYLEKYMDSDNLFYGYVYCYTAKFPYREGEYKYAVCNGFSFIKSGLTYEDNLDEVKNFAGEYYVYLCPFRLIDEPTIDIYVFEEQKSLLNFMSSYTGKEYSGSFILGVTDFLDNLIFDNNSVLSNIGSSIGSLGVVSRNTTGTIKDLFFVFEDMSANVRLWGVYLLAGIITAFVIFLILKVIGFIFGIFGFKSDKKRYP